MVLRKTTDAIILKLFFKVKGKSICETRRRQCIIKK